MSPKCVNVSNPAFKRLAKDLNVGKHSLELLAHEYNMITGDEKGTAFLTEEGKTWIKSRLTPKSQEALPNVVKLWKQKYSKPTLFESQTKAIEAQKEAVDVFGEGAVVLKETAEGKYKLEVAEPTELNIEEYASRREHGTRKGRQSVQDIFGADLFSINEEINLSQAIEALSRNEDISPLVDLLRFLNKKMPKITLKLQNKVVDSRGVERDGLYNASTDTILISKTPSKPIGQVVAHEVLHPLLLDKLNTNQEIKKGLEAIIAKAREKLGDTDLYGLTSPEEFLSELFTEGKLIKKLSNIKGISNKAASTSLLTEIKNWFKRCLNLIFEEDVTLLDNVLYYVEQLIDSNTEYFDQNNFEETQNLIKNKIRNINNDPFSADASWVDYQLDALKQAYPDFITDSFKEFAIYNAGFSQIKTELGKKQLFYNRNTVNARILRRLHSGEYASASTQEVNERAERVRKFLADQQRFYNEIKTIQDSGRLSNTEVREVAADVAYAVSDLITQIQKGEVDINELVPGKTTEKPISEMSRKEILQFVGIYSPKTETSEDSGAFSYVRRKFFGNIAAIKGEGEQLRANRKAAVTINQNFRAIVELAAEEFVNVEGFGLKVVEGKPAEIVEGIGYNIDDVNSDAEANEILERTGDLQEYWQINFRTIDVLGSMSQIVRQALLQCYKLDSNGNPLENRFGIKKRVSAREATSQILRWTQGAIDMKSMIAKLQEHAESNPWINQIISRLERGKKSDAEYGADTDFRSQFYNVFNKHFQLYTSITKDADKKYYSTPSNEHPALKDMLDQIQAAISMDQVPVFQGGRILKEKFASVKASFDELPALTEAQFKELSAEQIDDVQTNIWNIMKELGAIVTDEQIKNTWSFDTYKTVREAFYHITDTLTKHLEDSVYDPFAFKGGIKGNLAKALGALITDLEDVAVSSFYDNGKTYYSFVTPSYLTKFLQKMRLQGKEFDDFVEQEFGQYDWFKDADGNWRNPWLEDIVVKGDKGFKCGNIPYRELFAHKVELNFNKKGYMREMSPAEYSLSLLTEFFVESGESGKGEAPAWYRVPILSNKPSSEFIRFKRYTDVTTYKARIIDDLMKVFAQELGRIKTTKARNMQYKKGSSEYIANLDENGRKFNFLPYLNKTNNSEFNSLLERKTAPNASPLSVEDEAKLNKLAREEIKKYIDERTKKILAEWKNNGVMQAALNINGVTKSNVETQLENFIWNDHLATIMIEEFFVTDIALYKNTEDLQKRIAQIHAPGVRGDVAAVDYDGKRVSADGIYRTILLKDFDSFKSNVIDNIAEVFARREEGLVGKELAAAKALHKSIIDQYKKINVADAQGYSSFTSRRKKDFIMGLWSRDKEAAYKAYQRALDNDYSNADLASLFNLTKIAEACEPEKPFCYSQIKKSTNVAEGMSNYKLGVQLKNSEYLLIMADAILQHEKTAKPNILRAISNFMEESARLSKGRGIDTVQFESAAKALKQGVVDLNRFYNMEGGETLALQELQKASYTDETLSTYNTSVVHEIPFEDWCIQQPVPNHFYDHAQAQGSQGRMIIPSDLPSYYKGEEVKFSVYGKSLTTEEFKTEYEKTTADLINSAIEDVRTELGIDETSTRLDRNIAIAEILQREIKSSPRYGTDLLRACTLIDGEFAVPLADPIQAKRIEQLLNAVIRNKVNKVEIAGGPVVQVSNYGTSQDLNIRFKDKEGGLLATKAEFAETAKAKGLSSSAIDKAYKDYVKENQAGVAYYEVYAPRFDGIELFTRKDGSVDMEAIEKQCPELLELIAYRIPTEDKYSMAPCKIVGFLPKMAGAGIMMPADITTITGSDFDIDKMYVMKKEFIRQKGSKGNRLYFPQDDTTIGKKNRIVEMYKAVLTHETVADKILNPGGFEPQKRMGYMVEAYKNNPRYSWEELQEIASEKKNIEVDGKELTGTDALKALSYKASDLGFVDTQIQFYKQNSAAASILAIFAVAKVAHATLENNKFRIQLDGADDYGVQMRYPINIAGTSIGKQGDMTAEVDPTFNTRNEYVGKSLGCLVASAADAVKDPVLNLMNINQETVNVLNTLVRLGVPFEHAALLLSQKVFVDTVEDFYKTRLDKSTTLSEVIKKKLEDFGDMGNADNITLTEEDLVEGLRDDKNTTRQYQVLFTIDRVMRMHNAIMGLNSLTRFNSIAGAVGPLIIDNIMKEMRNQKSSFSQVFRTLDNGQYSPEGIKEAVFAKHPILESFYKTLAIASEVFTDMPEESIFFTSAIDMTTNDFDKIVYRNRKVLNKYADFFKSYMLISNGVINPSELSYYIKEFPKEFAKIKQEERFKDNSFIHAVQVYQTTKGDIYLRVNSSVLNDQTYKGDLSASWADLVTLDKELAIKLFKYCFFRGGIGFTPKTFMQLVPLELKQAISGYVETYRTPIMRNFPINSFARMFAQNNWRDQRVAPEMRLVNKEGNPVYYTHMDGVIEVPSNICKAPYMKMKDSEDVYHLYERFSNSSDIISLYKEIPILGGNGDYLEFTATPMDKAPVKSFDEVDNSEGVEDDATTIDAEVTEFVSEFTKERTEQAKLMDGLDKLSIKPTTDNTTAKAAFKAVQNKVSEVTEEAVKQTMKEQNNC